MHERQIMFTTILTVLLLILLAISQRKDSPQFIKYFNWFAIGFIAAIIMVTITMS